MIVWFPLLEGYPLPGMRTVWRPALLSSVQNRVPPVEYQAEPIGERVANWREIIERLNSLAGH